jgi:signal transduction histidine kinase
VQQTLQQIGEQLVKRRIRLVKKLSPDVPVLLLDAARVRDALANLLRNAIESVALGGRIKVESRRLGGHVVVEISHDGVREPGSALDQLFVPFTVGPGGRPNLGMAERIVREHGGEIRTRSEGEWSAVVAFALPIRENQDRRHTGGERRSTAHDRRLRFPESLGS